MAPLRYLFPYCVDLLLLGFVLLWLASRQLSGSSAMVESISPVEMSIKNGYKVVPQIVS